jgi:hypothetical protein
MPYDVTSQYKIDEITALKISAGSHNQRFISQNGSDVAEAAVLEVLAGCSQQGSQHASTPATSGSKAKCRAHNALCTTMHLMVCADNGNDETTSRFVRKTRLLRKSEASNCAAPFSGNANSPPSICPLCHRVITNIIPDKIKRPAKSRRNWTKIILSQSDGSDVAASKADNGTNTV